MLPGVIGGRARAVERQSMPFHNGRTASRITGANWGGERQEHLSPQRPAAQRG